jgi:DNA polymerase elongation subunit (family B)
MQWSGDHSPPNMVKLFLLHVAYEKLPDGNNDRFIHIFTRTEDGDTCLVTVKEWMPYGYVKLPKQHEGRESTFMQNLAEKHTRGDVSTFRVVRRKQFVGFTNLKSQKYIMFRSRRWPIWEHDILEGGVKAHHKFFHETGLRSGAWFEIKNPIPSTPFSTCKYHFSCAQHNLKPLPDITTPPKLTIMAYDLETTGLDPSKCTINQVCLIFWDTHQQSIPEIGDEKRSVVICTQPTTRVKGTNVIVVPGEWELLNEMARHILRHDPDILTGYNLSFDNKFLMEKARKYQDLCDRNLIDTPFNFYSVGRFPHVASFFQESQITNAAMGCNDRVLWTIAGRAVIDLFMYAKANFTSMPDYKLNTMSEIFISSKKEDIHYGQIFEAFSDSEKNDLRGEVAFYCAIDGRLCLQLMKKWSAHIACMEEASVACMNYADISVTGRQIKVVSMIQGEIHGEWVFNTPPPAPEGGFQGATVIDPITGFYGGPTDQVVLLDFAR